MDKSVFETLIELTQNKIKQTDFEIERETQNLNRIKFVEIDYVSKIEKTINKYKSEVKDYQNCIDHLKKLKYFEFPNDFEIEIECFDPKRKYVDGGFEQSGFFDGANWAIENIKSKLP